MSDIQQLPRWAELDDGINLVQLSLYESLENSQTYESIGGNTLHRMLDGTGVKQTNWAKIKTTLSGSGGLPLGFSGLDYSGLLTLKCGAKRAVSSTLNVLAIPSNRRIDGTYQPTAKKRIDGFYVDAVVNVVANTATVVLDVQATAYMVLYYPQIQVFMNDPSESLDIRTESSGWSITAEEF